MRLLRLSLATMLAALLSMACGSSTGPVAVTVYPIFSLVDTPMVFKATTLANGKPLTTVTATFELQVQAVGGDIQMANAYVTPTLVDFGIYVGGVRTALSVATSINYPIPQGVPLVPIGGKTFTVTSGTIITVPIVFTFDGQSAAGVAVAAGSYAVGVDAIRWSSGGSTQTETFMAGQAAWKTPQIVLP